MSRYAKWKHHRHLSKRRRREIKDPPLAAKDIPVVGGRGKKTLRRKIRSKRRKLQRRFKKLPRLARMVTTIAIGVAFGFAAVGVTDAAISASKSSNVPTVSTRARPRAVRRTRVVVIGDGLAFGLAAISDFKPPVLKTMNANAVALLGCSITPGAPYVDGTTPLVAKCDNFFNVAAFSAFSAESEVNVVLTGPEEALARIAGAKNMAAESPQLRESFLASLDRLRTSITTRNQPLLIATAPCDDNAVDAARSKWVNAILKDFADLHPQVVRLIDLNAFLCAAGRLKDQAGGPPFKNGILTKSGGASVWSFIEREVQAAKGSVAH